MGSAVKPEQDRRDRPIEHVVICGEGLAAHMTAAALSHQLPPSIRITLVRTGDRSGTDLFYGSVTTPTAYDFNRSAGVAEPALVVESDTAFSWGSKYVHWAGGSRSWIQCFHLALPVIDGVMFHHYLTQQGIDQLERFLLPAVAGRKGAFIHPPSKARQAGQELLSRAEYGYQFDPQSYARLFESGTNRARIQEIRASQLAVERGENGIAAIRLADGQKLAADLYLDCTGPDAALSSDSPEKLPGNRRLRAALSETAVPQLGPPVRSVTPADYGWRAETPLRGRSTRLTVYDPEMEAEALAAHGDEPVLSGEVTLGRRAAAWSGNCVAIGQSACLVEPLTPAPVMLLERDIERLLSLIPFSSDMSVERREYNRRFGEDHDHAELFTRALFETDGLPDGPYWRSARAEPPSEKLARKIALFEDRGMLVSYDLEPFNQEDWTILHYGMGRRPARHDRTADRAPPARVQQFLSNLRREIEKLVETLPSHATYMAELKQYLVRNRR